MFLQVRMQPKYRQQDADAPSSAPEEAQEKKKENKKERSRGIGEELENKVNVGRVERPVGSH